MMDTAKLEVGSRVVVKGGAYRPVNLLAGCRGTITSVLQHCDNEGPRYSYAVCFDDTNSCEWFYQHEVEPTLSSEIASKCSKLEQ